MTINYGPNLAPGDVRRRAFRIEIEVPNCLECDDLPSLTYHEEDAILCAAGGERQIGAKPVASVALSFDPEEVIPLRDPVTDAVVPDSTFTGDQLYAFIYSLVRKAQDERNPQE